jgi:Glycosyl transferase family 2
MTIGLCLIIKNETHYLEEWLNYHKKIGIDYFIIYDNESDVPIVIDDPNISVIPWKDNIVGSQMRAYEHCCKHYNNLDYIGFIDTDEFYESVSMNIKKDFESLSKQYGEISGLGLYWRYYGKPYPYFNNRVPIEEYTDYHNNGHIKSFINPKTLNRFPDPHKPIINGKYIDEIGRTINGPIGNHTSQNIWIKHTWTRSLNEFNEKIIRGSGDKVIRIFTPQHFYDYNDKCLLKN